MKQTPELFEHAVGIQGKIIDKIPSDFMQRVSKPIFDTVLLAANDVATENFEAPLYAIPACTGSGKTSFICGMMVSLSKSNADYSAAFVTQTIKEAHKVYITLLEYIDKNDIYIHTSAHGASNPAITLANHDIVLEAGSHLITPSNIAGLKSHRIIICTHEHWIKDMQNDTDLGVSLYQGRQLRSNIIIDEQPDIYKTDEIYPSDIEFLKEQLAIEGIGYADASNILSKVKGSMLEKEALQSSGFGVANIISKSEFEILKKVELGPNHTQDNYSRMNDIFQFLGMASQNRCFISKRYARRGLGFIAYSSPIALNPGTILLDATSNIFPIVTQPENIEFTKVPKINYRNLNLTHIEAPDIFKRITRADVETRSQYIKFIKQQVKSHTSNKDEVLLVVHKNVAEHISGKLKIGQRTVHIINWGNGIGSNAWRNCSSVFLFGEYHLPRQIYLSDTHLLT